MKGLVSDRNRSSSSSSSDSDAGPGAKRERSLSVGSKEILAYRREQEMRQQRELDKLKGIKVEESEVKEVPKAEEDSDSETEWKKSKPLAEKLRTVIAPSISSEVTAAPSIVPAPTVASEVVQKSVEPVPPPTLRKLKATVEKEESGVSDLVKQERLQVKREVEELKKKVAEVKKRRSAESKDAESKKKERRESGEEEPMDEVERLRLQALKTLRSRTESGRSKSPSPGKKAALSEGLSDNVAVKKKSSKVSKELDEERKRVENQVKESLQKLNKTSEDTMELLTSLDKKKKKQKKDESDSESEESEKEKRKKKKSKKSKESDDSDSESEKKKKKKRSRADSDDDSDSEAEKKKKAKKKSKKEESDDSDSDNVKKKKAEKKSKKEDSDDSDSDEDKKKKAKKAKKQKKVSKKKKKKKDSSSSDSDSSNDSDSDSSSDANIDLKKAWEDIKSKWEKRIKVIRNLSKLYLTYFLQVKKSKKRSNSSD